MNIILRILINAVSIVLVAYVVPGIDVSGFYTACLVALVLGLINLIIKPILLILTLPITIITLGLFTFVINALLFWLTSTIVKGFTVSGFIPALLGSLVFSIVSSLAAHLLLRNSSHE